MNGKNRSAQELIRLRIEEKQPLIQVVVGPRQVGKTTAIRTVIDGRGSYFSADSPSPLPPETIRSWWAEAARQPEKILAIDEIQKIPGWSEVIKHLWDQAPRKMKVVLSGSAALNIEKGLRESLAGRFELIRFDHWSFDEAREIFAFDLRQYIEFGCYPGSIPLLSDRSRWAQYVRDSIVEPAIGRDLLQLHPVDSPALLRQVFGLAAAFPARIFSLNKLQAQLQDRGALATIQHYLDLLGAAFLVTGLQKFSTSALHTRRSPPKLILHDNALMRCFRRPPEAPIDSIEFGYYLENLVGARFIAAGWDTFYWKDRDQEVDFVTRGPQGENWAIEVKSATIKEKDLSGLKSFCAKHMDFEPCLISFVGQKVDGVRSLHLEHVLGLSAAQPKILE